MSTVPAIAVRVDLFTSKNPLALKGVASSKLLMLFLTFLLLVLWQSSVTDLICKTFRIVSYFYTAKNQSLLTFGLEKIH